ncbi:Fe-S protein assembly co-chaperone HscB [Alkanindiges sp. WGS2144]|uniref:Fe-S protein assembly co-chaperone HscB n=1 Tax=Alkanindiges sp. WGS2144 TaxID=3366808 RepID=UPI0037522D0A
MTYFELFDISPGFDVDPQQLKTKYRQLQQQYHPDKNTGQAAQAALQQSSQINQAYQTLLHADSRAAYLLRLNDQDGGLENSIGDLDFLQHALELREQLEEANSSEQLSSLRVGVNQWLESLSREFKIDLAEQDWVDARDTTRKLRFIQRVLLDIDKAEDRLDEADFDDIDSAFDDF